MRFAVVNNKIQEAEPGLKGFCSGCGSAVIAKCGAKKVHHWSHYKVRDCDSWWENETEWHRAWKNHFPKDWQEKICRSDLGELHRADVKTVQDWVLEFQHSAIDPTERRVRTEFYNKIVWIVNGVRRKKDAAQFFSSLNIVGNLKESLVQRVCNVTFDKSVLLQDWANDLAPVIFDFSEPQNLWCIFPKKTENSRLVIELSRNEFVKMHILSNVSQIDYFEKFISFYGSSDSGEALLQKIQTQKYEERRLRQLKADEARRNNVYINHRLNRRF